MYILVVRFPVCLPKKPSRLEQSDFHHYELEFIPKIKLERKQGPSGGGCG